MSGNTKKAAGQEDLRLEAQAKVEFRQRGFHSLGPTCLGFLITPASQSLYKASLEFTHEYVDHKQVDEPPPNVIDLKP